MSKYQLIHGNSLDELKKFPDNYFHSIVTSPPYWQLRDYFCEEQLGMEETPEEFVENLTAIMREAKRVLRTDGVMWMVIGDTYSTPKRGNTQDNVNSRIRRGKLHQQEINKKIPKGMRKKNLIGIPWKTAFSLQEDDWILRCDNIWCLSAKAKVYVKTPDGIKIMSIRNMFRGFHDQMEVWTGGKWTRVLNVLQKPRKGDEVTITLRSGERFYCSPEHKWITEKGEIQTKNLKVGDILKSVRLPEPDNIISPEFLPDEDIGWFVGMYLAEGSRSNKTIQIASHIKENERFKKLKKIAEKYDGTCKKYYTHGKAMSVNLHSEILNSLINKYIEGDTAKNKHLTNDCWNRSNVFLKALIEGYLEGDGHWDEKNDRWRLGFTRNYDLEQDFRTLANRLGYDIRMKIAKAKIDKQPYKIFSGQLRNKKSNHYNSKHSNEIMEIKHTDYGGKAFYYDITVKDKSSIYALSSGILTHNSKTNGMPDGAKDRPTRSHEYIFMFSKNENYFFDHFAIMEVTAAKGKNKRKFGAKNQKGTFRQDQDRYFEDDGMRNKRSVWSVPVASSGGKHFGVFPTKLIEPCILSSTSAYGCCVECETPWQRKVKEDGQHIFEKQCECNTDKIKPCRVLDPFAGISTTGVVCLGNNIDYIGIELNEEYIQIAETRLSYIDPIFGN